MFFIALCCRSWKLTAGFIAFLKRIRYCEFHWISILKIKTPCLHSLLFIKSMLNLSKIIFPVVLMQKILFSCYHFNSFKDFLSLLLIYLVVGQILPANLYTEWRNCQRVIPIFVINSSTGLAVILKNKGGLTRGMVINWMQDYFFNVWKLSLYFLLAKKNSAIFQKGQDYECKRLKNTNRFDTKLLQWKTNRL